MLPIVGVAGVNKVGDGDVFFEVIPVQVDAPAVVAPLAGVDVVVVEVGEVATVGRVAGPIVRETLHDVALGVDGRDVVASIGVKVQRGLPFEVIGCGSLGESRWGGRGTVGDDGGWCCQGGPRGKCRCQEQGGGSEGGDHLDIGRSWAGKRATADDYGGGRTPSLGRDALAILYHHVDDGAVAGYLEGMKECHLGGRELPFSDDPLSATSNDVQMHCFPIEIPLS